MKKEEILALCIDEIQSGKLTIEQCTVRYPEIRQELATLLNIAAEIKSGGETPLPEFRRRAKQSLFEQTQEKDTRSNYFWFRPQQTAFRVLACIAVIIIILGAAGGGTVYASQSSLPGDMLYPVKKGIENLQLAVTLDAADKATLHLKLAQRRIDEATEQAQLNRNIDFKALGTVKEQYDNVIKELNNSNNAEATSQILSRLSAATFDQQVELEQIMSNTSEESQRVLKQTIAETRRGNIIAQVAYTNIEFLHNQPSVTDKSLDVGQFKIEGILSDIQNRTWSVDGTIIENIHYSGEVPAAGSQVKVEGIVTHNATFISRIEKMNEQSGTTKVEGKFGGKNRNGIADISGISVNIGDESSNELNPGDEVQLQGTTQDGRLKITNKDNQQYQTGNSTTLSGILTTVDVESGIITVTMTGNQIKVNISKAGINTLNRNQTIDITGLSRMIGCDIKLNGLYKRDNIYYAQQVRVDTAE